MKFEIKLPTKNSWPAGNNLIILYLYKIREIPKKVFTDKKKFKERLAWLDLLDNGINVQELART